MPSRTRARILEGAATAVARHGLAKLDMSDVSAISGVSRGTLYRYFPNRDALLAEYAARTPAGPVLTPADVANAIYLLCLPEAAMINGTTLFVDGGFAISG